MVLVQRKFHQVIDHSLVYIVSQMPFLFSKR